MYLYIYICYFHLLSVKHQSSQMTITSNGAAYLHDFYAYINRKIVIVWNVQTHVGVHIPQIFNALNGSDSFKKQNMTIPHTPKN